MCQASQSPESFVVPTACAVPLTRVVFQPVRHLVDNVPILARVDDLARLLGDLQLAPWTLAGLVHHEAADATSHGRRLILTTGQALANRRHDQDQLAIAELCQVLVEIQVAELPAAGLRRLAQVTLEEDRADLTRDYLKFVGVFEKDCHS